VVYTNPPVVVQPGTVVGTTPSYSSPPTTAPEPTIVNPVQLNPVPPNAQNTFEFHLARLTNPDEALRRESVMELGRMKNERALDPLAATLAGDRSANVRDAAARALGLIGSPRALTALIQAAQADNDRDVRHSAQFAVEIIRSNLQR
ncbi:MAG TPA: HEAT repeat domain-containing protein, partial [Gemmataceae bacterium]|nr:HEAT repeat domain-containing protein [Gemmataceae bacterium]